MAYARTRTLTGQTLPSLTIDGSADPGWNDCEVVGGTITGPVTITKVSKLRLNGVEVTAPTGIGIKLEPAGSQDVEIANCYVHDCGLDGIHVDEGTATNAPRHVGVRVVNNRVWGCGKGVAGDPVTERNGIIVYAKDAVIEGNDINNTARGNGISIRCTGRVASNKIRNSGNNGIRARADRAAGATGLRLTRNDIALSGRRPESPLASGIAVFRGAYAFSSIEIDANTINEAPRDTIWLEQGVNALVHDNLLDGVGTLPPVGGNAGSGGATVLGQPQHVPGTICIIQAEGPPGSALLIDGDAALRAKTVALVGGAKMVAYGAAGQRAVRLDGAAGSYIEVAHPDLAPGLGEVAYEVLYRADAVMGGALLIDARDGEGSNAEEPNPDGANGVALGITATELRVLQETVDGGGGAHPGLSKVCYAALARVNGVWRAYVGLRTAASAALIATVPSAVNAGSTRLRVGAGVRGLVIGLRVSRRTGRNMTPASIPVVKTFPV